MGETNTKGSRSGRSWAWVAIGAVLAAAMIGALVGVVIVRVTGSDTAALTLEPAAAVGANPFTDSVTAAGPAVNPNVQTAVAATRASFTKDAKTGALVAPANAPGLYGGSGDTHVCNPQQLVDYLAQDQAKAKAWASVLDISTDDIASYIASLTPVLLTNDTLVTNHGFKNGNATSLQSVLQAGTAVMVDSTGAPRVKCNCGNPLTSPEAITLSNAKLTGTAWPNYNINNFTTINATTQITNLVIINVQTGTTYTQPLPVTPTNPGDSDSAASLWVAAQPIETVAAQPDGTTIKTSPDGNTWTTVGTVDGANVSGLAYGNGVWIALGSDGRTTTIYKSSDLVDWSETDSMPGYLRSVAYGDDKWVAVGSDSGRTAADGTTHSGPSAYTSADGSTWTSGSIAGGSDADESLTSVAYGDNSWNVFGNRWDQPVGIESSLTSYRSTNGTDWEASGPTAAGDLFTPVVAYHEHVWTLGTGDTGAPLSQSTDGSSWAPVNGSTPFTHIDALAAGDPGLLAIWRGDANGSLGNSTFYTSPDGKTWTTAGQLGLNVSAIAFGRGPAATPPTTEGAITAAWLRNVRLPNGTCAGIAPEEMTDLQLHDGQVPGIPGYGVIEVEDDGALVGDLDGDGLDDGVIEVFCSGGTTGWSYVIAYLASSPDAPIRIPYPDEESTTETYSAPVDHIALADGELTVAWQAYLDDDPRCCPSRTVTAVYGVTASGTTLKSKNIVDE